MQKTNAMQGGGGKRSLEWEEENKDSSRIAGESDEYEVRAVSCCQRQHRGSDLHSPLTGTTSALRRSLGLAGSAGGGVNNVWARRLRGATQRLTWI